MSSLSLDRYRIVRYPLRRGWLASASVFFFLVWATFGVCQTQGRGVLCNDGDGIFEAEFRTGIKVHVGAARNGGLATRACAAKLGWENHELVVANGVSQLDVDAFGVNFGDGVPVAAFQIKKSDSECCVEYGIYSLEKPPRLVRTIMGGEFFSASDVDLDGRVEIWTNDAVAVNGFEDLSLGELDSAPSVVFRFAHGQLLDVSAEFQSDFDDEITRIRAGIHPQDLEDFKGSDGKLTLTPSISAERMHHLRAVKIKVLEIVWDYLYSGREPDAWRSLAEMWPVADVDRIRAALVSARARGIHSQADGSSAGPPRGRKKHAPIFDAVSTTGPSRKLEVIPPRAILLLRPPVSETQRQSPPEAELLLDLVIDASGKVRSAKPGGKMKWVDPDLVNAALSWKFIPAFKDGVPVASQLRIGVSPRQ
ncbi:MAG TPA: hypothetical protein VKH18_11305 [Terriglobales bacterium]|nr:hypothetical protein [Terriglobales bacterium]